MRPLADLRAAYEKTTYWFDARPLPVAVRIGSRSRALDRMLLGRGASRWAFITAWNPRSDLRPHWYNVARQEQLLRALGRRGWQWLSAVAEGDSAIWPAEPGVLILGMRGPEACRLGRRFRQNAVVVGRLGRVPALLWCGRENHSFRRPISSFDGIKGSPEPP